MACALRSPATPLLSCRTAVATPSKRLLPACQTGGRPSVFSPTVALQASALSHAQGGMWDQEGAIVPPVSAPAPHAGYTAARPLQPPAAVATATAEAATLQVLDELSTLTQTSAAAELVSTQALQLSTTTTSTARIRLSCVAFGAAEAMSPVKPDMQDRHVVIEHIMHRAMVHLAPHHRHIQAAGVPSMLVGVCDGHSGASAAHKVAQRLPIRVAKLQMLWSSLGLTSLSSGLLPEVVEGVRAELLSLFKHLDDELLQEDQHKPVEVLDGTTALVGLQVASHLFVAHAGDSRAVLCRAGRAVRLTEDHQVDNAQERARIMAAGGQVGKFQSKEWRVGVPFPGRGYKVSAVSRSLGDLQFKANPDQPLISGVPEVAYLHLQPGCDTFVIYASDGLWGNVSDQAAVSITAEVMRQARLDGLSASEAAAAAAEVLIEVAREQQSIDDITVVVTPLCWDPSWN